MARPNFPPYTDLDPAIMGRIEAGIRSMTDELTEQERTDVLTALTANGKTRPCGSCGLTVIMSIIRRNGTPPIGVGIHLDDTGDIETLALIENAPAGSAVQRVTFSLN